MLCIGQFGATGRKPKLLAPWLTGWAELSGDCSVKSWGLKLNLIDLMQVTNCNPFSPPLSLSELNDSINENSDTVGQIVHYIMKNEANADVLKAMEADNSLCDPESPMIPSTPGGPPGSAGPLLPGGIPEKYICGYHLHTVDSAVKRDVCHQCRQKRWQFIKPINKS